MDFNINLKLDKVMSKIADSKTLRTWTYIVLFVFLIAILLWQSSDLIASIADLIRAIDGR